MPERAEARQLRLLEILAEHDEPQDLDSLAKLFQCDTRTIRRDLDSLQQLLHRINGIEVRRNRVLVARSGYSPGYFTDQLDRNATAKEAIARAIVHLLRDEQAVALTAGSTPYMVSREIRRAVVHGEPPHNLIVFTNSVPALLELIAAGVPTGALGEIYSPDDCAFHSPEFRSAFQPGVVIAGASGVLFGPTAPQGLLEVYSHRAEEAAFMKQLLSTVPEVIIAADNSKLGRRHPWSFGGTVLAGKRVYLVTDSLNADQRAAIADTAVAMALIGSHLTCIAADEAKSPGEDA
jgi:DeoR/GlpR family transcriptional regulator of sugar metabolism